VSLSGRAERTVRRVIRWERQAFGVRTFLSPRLRRGLRQLLGVGPLQEGRRYAPPGGLRELFETLISRNAEYVVLRWFEGLPEQVDGDIDFLVGDDDLPLFESLLSSGSEGVPCDLYSESGMPGFRYAGMPYFPAQLARRILSRRVILPGPISVPCAEDHFLSLAYHAVYQKGVRAGLSTSLRVAQPALAPMHDYRGTLTRLAEKLSLPVDVSMEGLEEYLDATGWRPPARVLTRLAQHNPWLREYLRATRDRRSLEPQPLLQVAS
jgi:hypothetical protein